MSEEVAQANGLLIEIARLRTDLDLTRASLAQSERATEAERLARRRAEADAGALITEFKRIRGAREAGLYGSARLEEEALLSIEHPGAALLAELEAAREERDQALAKVDGLNLAADQYSVSRDQWMLKAKAAEADAATLMNIVLDAAIWLDQLSSADGSGHSDLAYRLREIIDTRQYSGAFLLAELEHARAALVAARAHVAQAGIDSDDRELMLAIEAYDRATKGRET